jgi:hypothetical protein
MPKDTNDDLLFYREHSGKFIARPKRHEEAVLARQARL